MKAWQAWYHRARLQREIAAWGAQGHLDAAGVAQAQAQVSPAPTPLDWLRFWRDVGGWLAVLLLGAASVCFIAANWSAMSPALRLAGVQGLLVLLAGCALPARVPSWVRRLLLFMACVLVGVLLALIGQIYQVGADLWTLFALWALLMLPWALASASPLVALLVLAVANVALYLALRYWDEALLLLLAFTAGNGVALVAWEAVRRHWPDWDAGRYGARSLAAVLMLGVTGQSLGWTGETLVIWFGVSAVFVGYYRFAQRDLALLALWSLCAIALACVRLGWYLLDTHSFNDLVGGLLLLALLVLGAAAVAAAWLRRLSQSVP